jgi:hypothetical protein
MKYQDIKQNKHNDTFGSPEHQKNPSEPRAQNETRHERLSEETDATDNANMYHNVL